MGGEIWALCESKNGRVSERWLEVVGAALSLAGLKRGAKCSAVVFSDVEAAHRCGMGRAYVLHGATGEADSRGRLLAEAIEEYKPDIVLASAALEGRGVCSVAAAILGTGMSADCIDLAIGNAGELISTRPALGSSVIAGIVCPVKRPQITTIRPGSFEPVRVTEVETEVVEFSGTRTFVGAEVIGRREINKDGPDLARSRIIIAGGMGLASAAAFDRIRELARVLHAGVAASRAAVNAGYAGGPVREECKAGRVHRPRYLRGGAAHRWHKAGQKGHRSQYRQQSPNIQLRRYRYSRRLGGVHRRAYEACTGGNPKGLK